MQSLLLLYAKLVIFVTKTTNSLTKILKKLCGTQKGG